MTIENLFDEDAPEVRAAFARATDFLDLVIPIVASGVGSPDREYEVTEQLVDYLQALDASDLLQVTALLAVELAKRMPANN